MKRALQFFSMLLIILLTFISCKKEGNSEYLEKQSRINAVTDSIRLQLEADLNFVVPSISVFIQTPSDAWFSSSAGKGYQPITADTWFRFASNSKTFTSSAILNMQEDGWLNINDKITGLIPGSQIPYIPLTDNWDIPNKNEITIKMLLQHSAGVYDADNDSVPGCDGDSYTYHVIKTYPAHQFTAEEMVAQNAKYQLSYFKPGSGHHYSNTGYAILSEIAGRIYSYRAGSQNHLTDYLYDKIYGPNSIVPLKAHFPYLATDMNMPSPFACGHYFQEDGTTSEVCSSNMSAQVGEGNGYSTMRDLNKFIRTLIKGSNVLTASSVQLMTTEFSPGNSEYALGCKSFHNMGFGHNGAREGNMSFMMYDPVNDVSVITYINAIYSHDVIKTGMPVYYLASETRKALGYQGL